MPCYKPLQAFRSLDRKTDNGKTAIYFKRQEAGNFSMRISLPCGQCIGCRIDRSKAWALRCIHEASLYENNCFITLTFNDDKLNDKGTLVKSDFQNFMKRLRSKYHGIERNNSGRFPIRYFHCGEYGNQLQRPHHHACLFNFDFPDKVLWSIRDNIRLYRSEQLEKLWKGGFATLGEVTWESAAYCARYITKKITGEPATEHYLREDKNGKLYYLEPEYITMSRRPGIGKDWFREFGNYVFDNDYITDNGKTFKMPRYYDKLYDKHRPEDFNKIRKKRLTRAKQHADNNTDRRLYDRRIVAEARMKKLERSYENGTENLQCI